MEKFTIVDDKTYSASEWFKSLTNLKPQLEKIGKIPAHWSKNENKSKSITEALVDSYAILVTELFADIVRQLSQSDGDVTKIYLELFV